MGSGWSRGEILNRQVCLVRLILDRPVCYRQVIMSTGTAAPVLNARDRLLAAADELFYEEGIHTVGIDRVIERAGVAKATLYSAFGNKEGLVRAYLEGRLAARQGRINRAIAEAANPRDKMLAVYESLARVAAEAGFKGCAFVNASAESQPGGVVQEASDVSRAWTHELFLDLAREAGATDPEELARQLVVLYDGAMLASHMDRDSSAAITARVIAAATIDAAVVR
jgi:AcrR family transcriptional regulator